MSKTDFIALIPVAAILIGFIYFNYVYPKKSKKENDKDK